MDYYVANGRRRENIKSEREIYYGGMNNIRADFVRIEEDDALVARPQIRDIGHTIIAPRSFGSFKTHGLHYVTVRRFAGSGGSRYELNDASTHLSSSFFSSLREGGGRIILCSRC